MMFGVEAIAAMQWAIEMRRLEAEHEKKFLEGIAHLPAEQQAQAIRVRAEAKEKLRKEREIERRHRELCQAIRDSRPRGIGLFL